MMDHATTQVIVIGAGAAGLLASGISAGRGFSTTLIEKNTLIGKKLLITGKGRCNVTNDCDVETFLRHVKTNGRFLYSALTQFTPQDMMHFLESLSLPLKVERGQRVFPVSDRASDVVHTLEKWVKKTGCKDNACRGKEALDRR